MKEFEIKSKIHSIEGINHFLQSLSFEKEKRIIDVYYDTPNYKFFELGVFIRIRNDKKLDVKYNSAGTFISSAVSKGTTTSNNTILSIAKRKAASLKFPASDDGGVSTIIFNFRIN